MGWESHTVGELDIRSGDDVYDSLIPAIKRIRTHYLNRYGRRPYLAELVFALCSCAHFVEPRLFEDADLSSLQHHLSPFSEPQHSDQIDPSHYIAMFDAEDGDIVVYSDNTSSQPPAPTPLLRVQVEDNRPNGVVCRYVVFSNSLSPGAVRSLIRYCVLAELLQWDLQRYDNSLTFECL